MKKVMLVFLCVVAFTFGVVIPVQNSYAQDKPKDEIPASKATKVIYTCSMHPEIVSDKPGKCPKCHMDLIKKEVPVKEVSTKIVTKKDTVKAAKKTMQMDHGTMRPGHNM